MPYRELERANSMIALIYAEAGNESEAQEYRQKAQSARTKLEDLIRGNRDSWQRIYRGAGEYYENVGDFKTAREYYQKAEQRPPAPTRTPEPAFQAFDLLRTGSEEMPEILKLQIWNVFDHLRSSNTSRVNN